MKIYKNGVPVATEHDLDFIEGSGVTLAVTDEAINGAVSVTIGNGGSLPSVGLLASGDTTGVTDAAALQAAHDALPAAGGAIQLGIGKFYVNTGVTFTKPISLRGWGGGLQGDASAAPPVALTTIYCTADAVDAITVSAAGCVLQDFALINTLAGTPTSGTGIKDTLVSNSRINGVTVLGFYNCLDLGGDYYNVSNSWIYDPVNYGVYLHGATSSYFDHGDMGFSNCVFAFWTKNYTANALIRYESGGGLKITGCKLNGGGQPGNATLGHALVNIDLVVAHATSSLIVTGCSLSAAQNYMISLTGTGGFSNVVITGNEIATGLGAANTCVGVLVNHTTLAIHEVEISGNVFNNLAGGGIVLGSCSGVHIGPNHWGTSMTGPLITLAGLGLSGNVALGVRVDRQSLGVLDAIDVVKDNRNASITNAGFSSTGHVLDGGVDYDYTRQILLTVNGTWVTQYVLKVPRASGGVIEVELNGQNGVSGNSTGASRKGVYFKQLRSYDVSTADVVTLTTVGTDVANGAGATFLAIQYVLAANQITIQVQTTDVTQVWFGGEARVKVKGKLDTFHIGA